MRSRLGLDNNTDFDEFRPFRVSLTVAQSCALHYNIRVIVHRMLRCLHSDKPNLYYRTMEVNVFLTSGGGIEVQNRTKAS